MATIEFTVHGLQQAAQGLEGIPKKVRDSVGRELFQFAEEVMAVSKTRVPVKTGTLMNTGHVDPPVNEATSVFVTFGYGGPAAPYALYVHEALEGAVPPNPAWSWAKAAAAGKQIQWTRPGSGPKYLENPLKEKQDELPARIKAAIHSALHYGE